MRCYLLVFTLFFLAVPRVVCCQEATPTEAAPHEEPKSEAVGLVRLSLQTEQQSSLGVVIPQMVEAGGIARKAIRKAAGVDPGLPDGEMPNVTVKLSNDASWLTITGVTIVVRSYDAEVPADKVLDSFREVLDEESQKLDLSRHRKLSQLNMQERQLGNLAADLSRNRESLWNLALVNKIQLDPEVARETRIRLETELQAVQVEKRGLEARREVIEQQIARLGKQLEEGAGVDPAILTELAKSVEARRKVVEYWLSQISAGGRGSVEDLEKAKDQLAQAQAELARYRRSAAEAAGGQRIAELKHRLEDTTIELAEVDAKQKTLDELVSVARNHSAQVEMKKIEVELLEQEYRQGREQLEKLKLELQQHIPPSVTLVPLETTESESPSP